MILSEKRRRRDEFKITITITANIVTIREAKFSNIIIAALEVWIGCGRKTTALPSTFDAEDRVESAQEYVLRTLPVYGRSLPSTCEA